MRDFSVQFSSVPRVASLCAMLAGTLAGCTGKDPSGNEVSTLRLNLADVRAGDLREGADLIDEKGRLWKFAGRAGFVPAPLMPEPRQQDVIDGPGEEEVSEEEVSIEELAEMLRGTKLVGDFVYETEPDYELAALVREAQLREPSLPPFRSLKEGEEAPVPIEDLIGQGLIFGTDNRAKRRDNTLYPHRTQIWLANSQTSGRCSATMIGPSTAVSAAHCFHSNSGGANGWYPLPSWAPGVDSQDSNRYSWHPTGPYPSPNAALIEDGFCMGVAIPTPYTNGNTDRQYDLAVIQFHCGWAPGNAVGWLGVWVIPSAYWDGSLSITTTHYSYGYPTGSDHPCPGAPTCNNPQIWGMGKGDSGRGSTSTRLEHESDMGSGQSGSGGYVLFSQDPKRYVVETHIGSRTTLFDDYNYGRRMTQTYFNSISAWSSWVPTHSDWSMPSQ